MQVELHTRETTCRDLLRAYIERRLRFALSRFGNRVGRVVVRIIRLNEDQGAGETGCGLEARLALLGTVTVKERSTDLFAAIDRAAGRAERLIANRIQQAHESRTWRGQRE